MPRWLQLASGADAWDLTAVCGLLCACARAPFWRCTQTCILLAVRGNPTPQAHACACLIALLLGGAGSGSDSTGHAAKVEWYDFPLVDGWTAGVRCDI
jgi:hypothetical protein